jgi:hypothetical protein
MESMKTIADRMAPEDAVEEVVRVVRTLLPQLDAVTRRRFLLALIGESQGEKVSSMVHLWLAECMGEGVDPTAMCQSLVDKVAQSKQLSAITDPELLTLFEDWLEELEEEVITAAKTNDEPLDADALVHALGLSQRGAQFLLSKLRREAKLPK